MTHKTWGIAHRGDHHLGVENTLEAFASAYAMGCDGVEFDVQLTRDGVPVIFHDDTLARLAGLSDAIHLSDWKSLSSVKLSQHGVTSRIPTLDEFLEQFGQKQFYLEIKIPQARHSDSFYYEDLAHEILAGVMAVPIHPETFVASFHLPLIAKLQSEKSFARLGAIYEDLKDFEAVMASPLESPLRTLAYHSLEYGIWRHCSETGKPLPSLDQILVWGIAGESEFQVAKAARLAGVVADDVSGMLRVLRGGNLKTN
jgi:glycerophosphoryl diester phosphodiesterase